MKLLFLLFICILILIGTHGFKIYKDSGFDYVVPKKGFEYCKSLTDIIGPEDIALGTNMLYISSNDNRKLGKNLDYQNGNIFVLNPGFDSLKVMEHDYEGSFHPHGIDYYSSPEGEFLFVVNHKKNFDTVIIFKIIGNNLELYKEIKDPLITNGNDIAAIRLNKFYLTRDHLLQNHFLRILEDASRIGLGKLLFYDNGSVSVIADGLRFANGLAFDKEINRLYMAEMLAKKIHQYDITNLKNPKLLTKWDVPGAPDNMFVNADALYVASHNKIFDLVLHQSSRKRKSPSSIYEFNKSTGSNKLLYSNDGTEISASSIAIPISGKMYLGTIFDKKFLVCNYEED